MDIERILNKLYSLHNYGVKLGLDNIKAFMEHLGNPQKYLKAFHIAGSNGKGSTSSFIASILMESGFKTGLYTSPHFVNFNERILIDGKQISNDAVAEFFEKNEKYIGDNKLTFFEVTTALAFQYFSDNNIDYAVIETGLGGRLDATNIFNAEGVVITSISLEHTNILGNTIKDIAGEKAAIIKENNKVFIGKLPDDAVNVVKEKCKETESELFRVKDFLIDDSLILDEKKKIILNNSLIPLKGDYQKDNAALAALTIYKTLPNIDLKIEKGLSNVLINTGIQGRYEYYCNKPDIILDSAHNPDGIKNFINEFKKKQNYSERTLLFSALNDKNIQQMLSSLKNYFDNFYFTEIKNERACKTDDFKKIADEINIKFKILDNPADFIHNFKSNASENECLVILGSMYLLGDIKNSLYRNKYA